MVVVIDMAAAARLTSVRRLRRHLSASRAVPDAAWSALALADEHALSPAETRLRLIWVLDAGLPRPVCNVRVLNTRTTSFVGVPDLLEVGSGMTAEYDGGVHRTAARHRRDTARLERFADAGLETCTVVGADLHDADRVVARLRAAYERAGQRRPAWAYDDRRGPTLDEVLDRRDAAS